MKRPLLLPLAIALALGGTNALALGLGPVHVKSKLNQPLDAEIPVIQGTAGEAEGLLVSLAAAEDFERVGISRSRLNVPLEFTLVKGANGQPVIKVTSTEPVRDAYLDFLVEANWPKGRLLREYTVLLDPPVTAPSRRTATTVAPAPAPRATTTTQPLREAAPKPVAAAPRPEPKAVAQPAKPAPAPAAPKISEGEYGPVAAGETLSQIAREARPDNSVNLNQVMLALLKSNPDAFFKDNVNALKRGAILRIPSAEEIRATASASAAAAEIQAQIEDWRGGRASPTRIADAGSDAIAAPPTPVKAATASTPKAGVAKSGGDERLELVPPKAGRDNIAMADQPGSGAGAAAASGALKAELARTKEALTAREQETGELKSRVGELEELTDKNERLISLKDSEIAELQRKLKELREASAAAAKADTAKSDTAKAEPATPAVEAPKPVTPAPAATSSAPVAATATAPAATDKAIDKQDIWGESAGDAGKTAPATTESTATTASGAVDVVTPPPASSTDSTPATTVTSPTAAEPASGGAVVTPLAPTPATVASSGPAAVKTPASTPVKPVAKPAPVVPPTPWYDMPWVKPAALGAGVLLLLLGLLGLRKRKAAPAVTRGSIAGAFGDSPLSGGGEGVDAVAAEAAGLREMLRDDPANVGLHLELLSIYYAERDVANFEDAAAEMQVHVSDPHQPEWLEAQAMGQELAPHNPLFSGAARYDDADQRVATAQDDTDEFPAFDDTYLEQDNAAHARSNSEYNFGDGAIGADTFAEVARAAPAVPAPASDEPFDFSDLPPLDEPAEEVADVIPEAPAAARLDDDYFPGEDAIGTKLDLAKAYMDMGDPDGARSMLEEVVAEGSDVQKAEAHRLIAELG